MAVSQEQKVDFLLKKIGFTASKTGSVSGSGAVSGTAKAGFAEAIPSPLVIASTSVWADSSFIPATPPGSDSAYVKVYLSGSSGLRMTYDNTVSNQRAFVARSTYGNQTSAILGDWIDTQFGADYIIKVYKGDPNSGGVQLSAAGSGSNDGWFFDYSSGILNFNDTNVPSGVTDTNIYIVGYRYTGTKGLQPPAGIGTFSTLDVTGISTFRNDVNFLGTSGKDALWSKAASHLKFNDNAKGVFGSGSDMAIYHSGGAGIIKNITGILQIQGNDVRIKNAADNADLARFVNGGAASLYHNNTARIYTTSTGAEVAGNLNVTGVLTYDDVTNIDSLGIVTARTGVHILANGINVQAGVATFAAAIDANGDLDVAGVSTFKDDVEFYGAAGIKSAFWHQGQSRLNFLDNVKLRFGDGHDLEVWHDGSDSYIENNGAQAGDLYIRSWSTNKELHLQAKGHVEILTNGTQKAIMARQDGDLELYHADSLKLETTEHGIDVTGHTETDTLNVSGLSTFAGAIDANGDLDVDGHTELDNVNISGVATVASAKVSDLTSGRVVYAGTGGELQDHSGLTFDGTNLTAASAKITDLTSGRVVLAGTSGALEDSNNLRFTGSSLIVTGSQTVSVDLNVTGISTVNGLLDANGGLTANTAKVEDLTSGRVVLAGTGGEIEDSGNLTFNGSTLAVTGSQTVSGNLDIVGNVSIGGTLTYEDVTNIDSVGIVTARTGIKVLSGGINAVGVVTSTNAIDANGGIDVAGVSTIANLKVGSVTVTHIRDEDNMASNSDTSLATQQSIKAYVDSQVTAQDLDFAGDSGTGAVDLDSQSLTIAGTSNEIETSASGQTITIGLPNDVTIGAALTVTGAIDANGALDVDGATTLDGLTVSEQATFNDDVFINVRGKKFKTSDWSIFNTTSGNALVINGGSVDTEKFRIASDGKVGIGTVTSPVAKLHIVEPTEGNSVIQLNSGDNYPSVNRNLTIKSGTGGWAGAKWIFDAVSSGGQLEFQTTSVKRLHILQSGYVGIGSGTPSALLDVNAGSAAAIQLKNTGTVNSMLMSIDSTMNSLYSRGANSSTARDFRFLQGSTEKLRIKASGDINIVNNVNVVGVSTFTGAIDANGDLDVDGHTELDNVNISGIVTTVNLNVSGSATIASIGATVGITSSVYFGDDDRVIMGDGDDLQVYHSGTASYLAHSGTGNFYIDGDTIALRKVNQQKYLLGQYGKVDLFYADTKRFSTSGIGVTIYDQLDTTNIKVSGVSTFTGNVTTSADVSFSGSSYNATWITAGDKLRFNDNASATFGTQDDLQIYHNNTSAYIRNTSGNLRIQPKAGEQGIILKPDGAVESYFDNSKKISTSGIGVTVYNQLDVTNINATGVITATSFTGTITNPSADITTRNLSVTGLSTFTGAIDANGDLDVDGHAEFDNIRVAGVSTFAGQLNAGAIAAASASFTGDVSVGGTLTYQDVTNIDSVGIVTARTDLHVGTGSTTIKTLNGKVGINSTVPVHMLDVGGVINSSTDIRINNVSLAGGASVDDATALAIALG